jgi:hypothetical protein
LAKAAIDQESRAKADFMVRCLLAGELKESDSPVCGSKKPR